MNDDDNNGWQPYGGQQMGKSAYTASQIVKNSMFPTPHSMDISDAQHQIIQHVTDLYSEIREKHAQLHSAQKEIAQYIDMIDEKNKKIEGQAKYIEILERQIKIAEKYIVREYK